MGQLDLGGGEVYPNGLNTVKERVKALHVLRPEVFRDENLVLAYYYWYFHHRKFGVQFIRELRRLPKAETITRRLRELREAHAIPRAKE